MKSLTYVQNRMLLSQEHIEVLQCREAIKKRNRVVCHCADEKGVAVGTAQELPFLILGWMVGYRRRKR
jgi:hypothetical protein